MDFDEDVGREAEIGVVTLRDIFLNIDDRASVEKIVAVKIPSIPTTEDREQLYTDLVRRVLNSANSHKLNDLDSGFEEVFLRKRTTWENLDTRTSRDALLKILQSNKRMAAETLTENQTIRRDALLRILQSNRRKATETTSTLRGGGASRKPQTFREKKGNGEPPIGVVLSRKRVSFEGAELTLTLKFPLDASFHERRFVYTGFIFNIFYWTMNSSSLSSLLDFEKDILILPVAGETEEAYNLRRGMVSELENGKSKAASSSLKRRSSEDARDPSSSSFLRSLQFKKLHEAPGVD